MNEKETKLFFKEGNMIYLFMKKHRLDPKYEGAVNKAFCKAVQAHISLPIPCCFRMRARLAMQRAVRMKRRLAATGKPIREPRCRILPFEPLSPKEK